MLLECCEGHLPKPVSHKPLAVVVGAIGKLPYAGMSLYFLHHIAGLQDLGYEVHYVERLNKPDECYNPQNSTSSDDPTFALEYLQQLLSNYGVTPDKFSFIDRGNRCHGSGWSGLQAAIARADFVLTVGDPTWFEELAACPRRAFIDCDPLFTQISMETGAGSRGSFSQHYPTLFSYCARFGKPDCTIPLGGRAWLPSRPVVATRLWHTYPPDSALPISALLHWKAGSDLVWEGVQYGHKDREFPNFLDLPLLAQGPFVLAVGGRKAPRDLLRERGWLLTDPLEQTGTVENYRRFIAASRADLGIAKHAYVASRSGWFSDRSTCFLAAGRPVLHQDTGFQDWLPTGEGILSFADLDDLKEAIRCLDRDYNRHALAARRMAEEHFEATRVIGKMLDVAGWR
jgi:hypothetical protein